MSSAVPMPLQRGFALLISIALALAAMVPLVVAPPSRAVSTTVTISEVYGGGGNNGATYTHDFIELRNLTSTSISLAGWSVQYASATGTSWQVTSLNGSIPPNGYYLVQEAQGTGGTTPLPTPNASGAIPMSATNGKVALLSSTTVLTGSCPTGGAIVDFVGYGSANCFEGTGPTATLSNSASAHRAGNGTTDTDDNAADFVAAAPAPSSSGGTLLSATGFADPATVLPGETTNLSVTVSPATNPVSTGITVSADLTAIGEAADQSFTSVGPSTFTFTATVADGTPGGPYSLPVRVADAQGRSATTAIALTVEAPPEIIPIGEIQGSVADTDDGTLHRSPFAPPSGNGTGDEVITSGVITQKFLQRTSNGGNTRAFFLQSTLESADGDPNSSDGIFVFHGSFTTLRVDGGGFYEPQVGDEVVLRGPVSEFFNVTQLSSPFLVEVVRTGVPLTGEGAEIEWTEASPPDDLAEANRFWERHEGMQFLVEAGAKVVAGRSVFASTADGEVWVIDGDHPVARRSQPYTDRVFRDVHPLDDVGDLGSFDNGNGYRIMLASHGIKATEGDNSVLIGPARTFDTITNDLTGALYFTFDKYAIEVSEQPEYAHGPDPSLNSPPVEPDREVEYSTAVYNVENLYDFRDDPFDGCDFTGNGGCPGVRPPFDYVPESAEAYQQQLADLADQIVNDLHAPDILLIQEAEDQDICTVEAGAFECGSVDDADGKPDTLQELAAVIEATSGVPYDAAFDRDGSDDRGIVNGFLFRSDRVELLEADADHPVLGSNPDVEYRSAGLDYNADVQNPKALNAVLPGDVDRSTGQDGPNVFTRDAQVGYFRVWRDDIGASVFTDVYAITNHFSSGPDTRVGQRTEQAAYNAAIIEALAGADDGARVVVGGDFNVFPRPDDPFAPGDPLHPSDQLAALYEIGLNDLWRVVVEEAPQNAYSYVFEGQAQTLDNQFTTDGLFDELNGVRFAHVNADFPAEYDGDGSRGSSDHDPQVARFDTAPTFDRLRDLIGYFVDEGLVDASKALMLFDRIDRAERFYGNGQIGASESQLEALGDQAGDLSPRWVDPVAAEALRTEALLLIELQ